MASKMRTTDFVFNDGTTQATAAKIERTPVYDIAGQTQIDAVIPTWAVAIDCWLVSVVCTSVSAQLNLGTSTGVLYAPHYTAGGGAHFGNATNQWTANYGFPFRSYSVGSPVSGLIKLRKTWSNNGQDEGWVCCGSAVSVAGNGAGHIAGNINLASPATTIRLCKNGGSTMQSGYVNFIFSSI